MNKAEAITFILMCVIGIIWVESDKRKKLAVLHDAHEVSQGDTVYLFPHTKGASTACQQQRTVKVMHPPARYWPYVVVEWKEDGVAKWERVHRDNIKKRPTATTTSAVDKKQGDGSGQVSSKWQRRLAIGTPVVNIEGQESLF